MKYYIGNDCSGKPAGVNEVPKGGGAANGSCLVLPDNPKPGLSSSYRETCTEGTTECTANEYCCPDIQQCFTPTGVSCANGPDACDAAEVCCPVTKICAVPGAQCTSPCDAKSYCCP